MHRALLKHLNPRLIRLFKIGGIVIALVLAFQVLLLPPIIHLALSIALRGMGLTDTSFQVRAASFFQTELAQFRINGQALARVGNIGFDYTPLSLLRGRVNSLWITGAEIQVSIQDGSITLGPLPLNERSSSPPSSSSSSKRLPFDQLELRSSALAVTWEGRQTWVPVEGSLLDLGGGKGKLDLLVRVQGGPVHVTGSFDRVGKALQLTADAPNLNAAALAAAIPAQFATLTPSVSSGTLSLQALYVQSPADTKLTASLAGTGLRLGANFDEHRLWMQNLGWSANVQFGAGLSLLAADLTATAERLSVDGEAAQNLVLSAKKDGPRLRLNATAQSPTWQLRKLDTTLTGLFDPQLRQPLVAETSFGLDAAIPRQIAKMLQFYRLDVSEMGSLSAEGQLVLKLPSPKAPHPDQSWELSAKEIQIALAPGDLSIAKDTTVLRGLAGVLRLTGQANHQQATVQLMPGSNFWLSNVDQRLSPITFAKADPTAALASVGIESQPAQFTLRFNNPDHPWLFQAPAASLTLAETAITLPDQVTKAQGLGVSLRVRAQVDPKGIEAYALPGSTAGFKSFETLAAGYKLQAKPWQLNLGSQPGQPLVHISTASTTDLPRFSFHAAAENALNAKNQALDLSIANLALGGTVTLNPTTGPALQAQLALNNTSLAYTPQSARVAGISATIPISWNTFTSDRGSFAVKTLQVGDTTYPALAGAVSVTDQRLDFSAIWPFLKDLAALNAQGWVDLAEQTSGQIVATISPFTLKDSRAMESLIPGLQGFDVSGTFQSQARISFRGEELTPLISLTMKDASIVSKEYERSLEGINGTIAIDSLDPIQTPGGQRLSVKQAASGKLKFSDGVLIFRIENSNVFHVEGTDWAWAGGRVYTNSFRLDLNNPRIDLMVTGDKLQLQQLLDVFAEKKATGEGTVYGRLPVQVIWSRTSKRGQMVTEWSEPRLEFGEGFLYATPGGGRLHVANAEALVAGVLGKQGARPLTSGSPDVVKGMLVAALNDLDYSVLKMDFTKESNTHLLGKLHMAGKGRGPNALEIGGITVNLHNIDDILREAVIMQKFSFGD